MKTVSRNGFTLVEIAVVVVIAGIILATGVPAFLSLSRSMSEAQARNKIMDTLRMARQKAVTTHTPVIVAFGNGSVTTNVTTYSVHSDTNNDRAIQSGEPWASYTLPNGTQLETVTLQPTDTLVFDSSGALAPSVTGGNMVVYGNSKRDTLYVSATGLVYRP